VFLKIGFVLSFIPFKAWEPMFVHYNYNIFML
jgi:hypothetical protein